MQYRNGGNAHLYEHVDMVYSCMHMLIMMLATLRGQRPLDNLVYRSLGQCHKKVHFPDGYTGFDHTHGFIKITGA